jgi:hypothetical protein
MSCPPAGMDGERRPASGRSDVGANPAAARRAGAVVEVVEAGSLMPITQDGFGFLIGSRLQVRRVMRGGSTVPEAGCGSAIGRQTPDCQRLPMVTILPTPCAARATRRGARSQRNSRDGSAIDHQHSRGPGKWA